MTMTPLERVPSPIHVEQVARWIAEPDALSSEPTGDTADLSLFRDEVERLLAKRATLKAKSDTGLAGALHQSLRDVRRRTLLDPRTWQWLTIVEFGDYTLARWADGIDRSKADELDPAQLGRFVGSASLVGRSRNALARLFWGADMAYSVTGDYEHVETVFANSDLVVGVAERLIGLDPAASIAIMSRLKVLKQKQRRDALKRLNHILSTTALEALSPQEAVDLLGVD